MDEMTTFENQLSAELSQMAGPGRHIDAAAMVRTATTQTPKWRFQSVLSATKFVVAGAIVALFGGFLLAGVSMQQPGDDRLPAAGASASATTEAVRTDAATSAPESSAEAEPNTTTRSDILPGVDLVTEEIEPGFLRVLSDGVRDLTGERTARIVYGQDGSVWLFRDKEFFRLGDADTHAWSNDKQKDAGDPRNFDDIEVGPDGVVWWADVNGKGLWSFDGQVWTLRRKAQNGAVGTVDEVEVLPDGTVLASWRTKAGRKVARLDADGWEVFKDISFSPNSRAILDTNDAGDVWLHLYGTPSRIRVLYRGRYQEGSGVVLKRVKLPPDSIYGVLILDGTLWAETRPGAEGPAGSVLRLDGTTWTQHGYPDGHPQSGWPLESTQDGHLWWSSSCEMRSPDDADPFLHGCELVHFDGQDVSRFELGDAYRHRTAVAPGGTFWFIQDGVDGGGLYVVKPEIDDGLE